MLLYRNIPLFVMRLCVLTYTSSATFQTQSSVTLFICLSVLMPSSSRMSRARNCCAKKTVGGFYESKFRTLTLSGNLFRVTSRCGPTQSRLAAVSCASTHRTCYGGWTAAKTTGGNLSR